MSMPAALDEGDELVFEQRASLPSFLGLSLRNGLLNLITLTLYRFWGKTEVRRRLWRSIHLNGEPFEYTGRGVELFLGFLFAAAVIGLPFLLAVFGAQLLGPGLAALVVAPLYLFLPFIQGYGRFTAFRYIASRTTWRGVRFHLEGSPARYGFKWLGYGFLSGFTLGWYWPAAQRKLAAPLWGGLRFGDREVRFDLEAARREKVYGAFAIGWVGMIVGYIVLAVLFASLAIGAAKAGRAAPAQLTLAQLGLIYTVVGAMLLGYVVLFAPYHAAMLRSIVSGISFDDVRFQLRVQWWEMAWMTLSNIVLVTVSLGFLMPFVEARTSRFLIGRLEAVGRTELSSIRQSTATGPRRGEGIADAFGVAPI